MHFMHQESLQIEKFGANISANRLYKTSPSDLIIWKEYE